MFSDYLLTFGPNVTSLSVPINITSDGSFEHTIERFSLFLFVSDFRLQLKSESRLNLQSVCQRREGGRMAFSVSHNVHNQAINIDYDRIFMSPAETGSGVIFSLAANESDRVNVSGPAKADVIIIDQDSGFLITQKYNFISEYAFCSYHYWI